MDSNPPSSSVHGILQAGILEWVAISFCSKTARCLSQVLSLTTRYCCLVAKLCPTLLRLSWTVAHQAPLSMGFSRQENWSGLPFPSPGDLPDPGIEPVSPALAGGFFTTETPGKPMNYFTFYRLYQYA